MLAMMQTCRKGANISNNEKNEKNKSEQSL
jgi:hypothetical protein